MLQHEQERSRRRTTNLKRAIVCLIEMELDTEPVHAQLNPHVPVLAVFFDGQTDLMADYRLGRHSMEALLWILPSKNTQGWSHEVHILIAIYWLAHDSSYSVVSRAFNVPKSTVCRLVHSGVEKIAALRQEVIKLPTAGALDEVGQSFAQLANSPVFSRCVGSLNGSHVRIKTPPGPGGQDYLNRKLFPSIQLQAVCDGKGPFINTFVGYPGSVNDTRVLKNSKIYKEALYPPSGFFILGDGGYPCMARPVAIITPLENHCKGGCRAASTNITQRPVPS
ncbi:putative nuclease HARBI1 [Anoplopoma fimbria]|uniref:putative nuclease HARBI1 n=1 Tax=Anoplopoma fimbria TaxID=229290 RepID=UPI0023EBB403|nr:putative nuclease HARBI1 [Anoplopoma fimbria]